MLERAFLQHVAALQRLVKAAATGERQAEASASAGRSAQSIVMGHLDPKATPSFRSCIGAGVAVPGQAQVNANQHDDFPLFRRSARPDTISTLYGMIVAQARMPCFYRDYAVADTVNGRFDLIVLHLALVLDRLAGRQPCASLGQGLFDRFCQDMDDNLREMGIGDLKVPKEMRRIADESMAAQRPILRR